MIKIVNVDRKPILFNTDTEEIKGIKCSVRAIDDIFVVPEDAKLHWENKYNGSVEDTDVNKGDIIVTFYNTDLGTDHVVVKSNEWLNAINHYNEIEQKRKESWAKDKCCNGCIDCRNDIPEDTL